MDAGVRLQKILTQIQIPTTKMRMILTSYSQMTAKKRKRTARALRADEAADVTDVGMKTTATTKSDRDVQDAAEDAKPRTADAETGVNEVVRAMMTSVLDGGVKPEVGMTRTKKNRADVPARPHPSLKGSRPGKTPSLCCL